jgi:hypothetical protein
MTVIDQLKEAQAKIEGLTADHAALTRAMDEGKTAAAKDKETIIALGKQIEELTAKVATANECLQVAEKEKAESLAKVAELDAKIKLTPALTDATAGQPPIADGSQASVDVENYYTKCLAIKDPVEQGKFRDANFARIMQDFGKLGK